MTGDEKRILTLAAPLIYSEGGIGGEFYEQLFSELEDDDYSEDFVNEVIEKYTEELDELQGVAERVLAKELFNIIRRKGGLK